MATGTLTESYLSEVHAKTRTETQSGLSDFSDTQTDDEKPTRIAVVIEPTGGILDVCDEECNVLGMPTQYLDELRQKRAELTYESDIKTHNKGVEQINLEQKYRTYLQNDENAQEKIDEIVSRLQQGESIELVCFEKRAKWCHRHVLQEEIEQKLKTTT